MAKNTGISLVIVGRNATPTTKVEPVKPAGYPKNSTPMTTSMTISQLIRKLEQGDEQATVYLRIIDDHGDSTVSDNVGVSFDSRGDVELYERKDVCRECDTAIPANSNGYCVSCNKTRKQKTIIIEVQDGAVVNVKNLPKGYDYELQDYDA